MFNSEVWLACLLGSTGLGRRRPQAEEGCGDSKGGLTTVLFREGLEGL